MKLQKNQIKKLSSLAKDSLVDSYLCVVVFSIEAHRVKIDQIERYLVEK